MRVMITGVGGFIGRLLADDLVSHGHIVSGSVSNPKSARNVVGLERLESYKLGDAPSAQFFKEIDVWIHCALANGADAFELNTRGTKLLYDAAIQQGVLKRIFISSISAFEGALNSYGQAKFEVEKLFRATGDCILRPGLVIGNGGLFERMRTIVNRFPVVPLIDGGRRQVYYVVIEDLVHAVRLVAQREEQSACTLNLFAPSPVSMSDLMRKLAKDSRKRRVFLPVPMSPFICCLELAEKMRIKLPITADNLIGMRQNSAPRYQTDLPKIIPHYKSLEDALAQL